MLVTDASGSMEADDVEPTRLAAAQRRRRALPRRRARRRCWSASSATRPAPHAAVEPDAPTATTGRAALSTRWTPTAAPPRATRSTPRSTALETRARQATASRAPAAIVLLSDGKTTERRATRSRPRGAPSGSASRSTPSRSARPTGIVTDAARGEPIPVPPDPRDAARDRRGLRRPGLRGRRRRRARPASTRGSARSIGTRKEQREATARLRRRRPAAAARRARHRPALARPAGVRVLVVDDDRSVRDALRRALTLGGYEVQMAEGGQQALAQVADRARPTRSCSTSACPTSTASRSAGGCAARATACRSSC